MKLINFKNRYFKEFNIWHASVGLVLASNVHQVELENAKYIYDISNVYPEEFDDAITIIMGRYHKELFKK